MSSQKMPAIPEKQAGMHALGETERRRKEKIEERGLTKEISKVLQCRRSKLQSSCCLHACESCSEFPARQDCEIESSILPTQA